MSYYQQGRPEYGQGYAQQAQGATDAGLYSQQGQQQGQQQSYGQFGGGYQQQASNGIPTGSMAGSIPTGSMNTSYATNGGNQDPNQLSKGLLAAFSASGYPGEPPLLEELGVNFQHIKEKTLGVLGLKSKRNISDEAVNDADMAGPIIFCMLFGTLLLLSGKTHFGYIYGVALFGTVSLHILFKLMSNSPNDGGLDILTTSSVLGYCLLPLVLLSALAVFVNLDNTVGYILGMMSVCWCTYAASGFFVRVLSLTNARALVAYPLSMFYTVFALMAIFVEKKEVPV